MSTDNKPMKENDFFVAQLNQPDFLFENFENSGLTTDNTQFLKADEYKQMKYIKENEAFKDPKTGEFSEELFDKTYEKFSYSYAAFATKYQSDQMFRDPQSGFNPFATSPYKTPTEFKMEKVKNPFLTARGTKNIFATENATLSNAEAAQANFLRDVDGNILEQTANDLGAFGLLTTSKDYALATYDEDGEHKDETGRMVKHSKGDLMLDEDGVPYYQQLKDDQSVSGKNLLTAFDIITTDGSTANEFDPFDNDNIEQSIGGTILRNSLKLAPLVLGNKVRTTYALTTAAVNFMQSLPQLVKAVEGILTNGETPKSDVWKTFNGIEGYTKKFQGSKSQYAQQNAFAAENWIDMLGDIPLQMQQQKAIAKIPKMVGMESRALKVGEKALKKAEEETKSLLEEALKSKDSNALLNLSATTQEKMRQALLSSDAAMKGYANTAKTMSAFYMAITSAADGYQSFIDNGYSPRAAGVAYMAQLGGLYGLMRYTDIGQIATQSLGLDDVKAVLKNSNKTLAKNLANSYSRLTPDQESKFYNLIKDLVVNVWKLTARDGIKGAVTNAVGEGIEEVTEEFITDAISIFGNALNALGVSQAGVTKYDTSEVGARYFMSLVGGAAGGAINVGIEKLSKTAYQQQSPSELEEIIRYIGKNGAKSYIDLIEKQYKKNKLGLDSAISISESKLDSDGNLIAVSATGEEDTQAWVVKESLKKMATTIDTVLKHVVPGGLDSSISQTMNGDPRLNEIVKLGAIDLMTSDYVDIVKGYVDAKLGQGENPTPDQEKNLTDATLKFNQFQTGEYYLNYAERSIFNLDKTLSSAFVPLDIYQYTKTALGKEYEELSQEDKEKVKGQYEVFAKYERPKQLDLAYQTFKEVLGKLDKVLRDNLTDYSKNRESINKILGQDVLKALQFLSTIDYENVTSQLKDLGLGMEETIKTIYNLKEALLKITSQGLKLDSKSYKVLKDTQNAIIKQFKTNYDKLEASEDLNDIKIGGKSITEELPNLIKTHISNLKLDLPLTLKDLEAVSSAVAKEILDTYKSYDLSDMGIGMIEGFVEDSTKYESIANTSDVNDVEFLKEIIESVIVENNIYSNDIAAISQQLTDIADNLYVNPVYSLLDLLALSGDVNTKRITELLANEEKRYKDSKQPADYVMETEERLNEVLQALNYIDTLELVVHAASNYLKGLEVVGHNFFINRARQQLGTKTVEDLLELTQEDSIAILQDIKLVKQLLTFLKNLSAFNNADKMRSFEVTKQKMIKAQYNNISAVMSKLRNKYSMPELEDIFKEYDSLNSSPGAVTLAQLMGNDGVKLDNKTIEAAVAALVGMENLIYDAFLIILGSHTLKDILLDFSDLTTADKNLVTSEKLSELSTTLNGFNKLDNLVHLIKMIGHKKSNFLEVLKTVLDKEQFKNKAPVYSQIYCAEVLASFIESPSLVNTLQEILSEIADYPTVLNFAFLDGYHGSGKSSTVGVMVAEYAKAIGKTFLATSIELSLVDNFKGALLVNTGLTKSELISNIFGTTDLTPYAIKNDDNGFYYLGNTTTLSKKINKSYVDSLPDVIFIDEATFYASYELQALIFALQDSGKIVLGMGDSLQEGARFQGNPNGIEVLLKFKTPILEFSLRADNIHTRDNNVLIRSLASLMFELETAGNVVSNYQALVDKIQLKHNTHNGKFTGTKIISNAGNIEQEFQKLLNSAEGDYSKIMLIYDSKDSDTYKALSKYEKNGLVLRASDKMQGLEADYVIIDSDISDKTNPLAHSRKLNTILSRSRLGNLLIDPKNTIKSIEVVEYGLTPLPKEAIQKSRDLEFEMLSNILSQQPADPNIAKNLANAAQAQKEAKAAETKAEKKTSNNKSKTPKAQNNLLIDDVFSETVLSSQYAPEDDMYDDSIYIPARGGIVSLGGANITIDGDLERPIVSFNDKMDLRDANYLLSELDTPVILDLPVDVLLGMLKEEGLDEDSINQINNSIAYINKYKLLSEFKFYALNGEIDKALNILNSLMPGLTILKDDIKFQTIYEPYNPAIHNRPGTKLNIAKNAPFGTILAVIETGGKPIIFTLTSIFQGNDTSNLMLPKELLVSTLKSPIVYPLNIDTITDHVEEVGQSVRGVYKVDRTKLKIYSLTRTALKGIMDLSNNLAVASLKVYAKENNLDVDNVLKSAGVTTDKKSLMELRAEDPTLSMSKPYIRTHEQFGQGLRLDKELKKAMKEDNFFMSDSMYGKPVIFIANRLNIKHPKTGRIISPSEYAEYYESYKLLEASGENNGFKPYISMHAISMSLGLTFEEYFEVYHDLLEQIKGDKSNARVLDSYANPAFTWRLLKTIFSHYDYHKKSKSPDSKKIVKGLEPIIQGLENILSITHEDRGKNGTLIKYLEEILTFSDNGVLVGVDKSTPIEINTDNVDRSDVFDDLFAEGNVSHFKVLQMTHDLIYNSSTRYFENNGVSLDKDSSNNIIFALNSTNKILKEGLGFKNGIYLMPTFSKDESSDSKPFMAMETGQNIEMYYGIDWELQGQRYHIKSSIFYDNKPTQSPEQLLQESIYIQALSLAVQFPEYNFTGKTKEEFEKYTTNFITSLPANKNPETFYYDVKYIYNDGVLKLLLYTYVNLKLNGFYGDIKSITKIGDEFHILTDDKLYKFDIVKNKIISSYLDPVIETAVSELLLKIDSLQDIEFTKIKSLDDLFSNYVKEFESLFNKLKEVNKSDINVLLASKGIDVDSLNTAYNEVAEANKNLNDSHTIIISDNMDLVSDLYDKLRLVTEKYITMVTEYNSKYSDVISKTRELLIKLTEELASLIKEEEARKKVEEAAEELKKLAEADKIKKERVEKLRNLESSFEPTDVTDRFESAWSNIENVISKIKQFDPYFLYDLESLKKEIKSDKWDVELILTMSDRDSRVNDTDLVFSSYFAELENKVKEFDNTLKKYSDKLANEYNTLDGKLKALETAKAELEAEAKRIAEALAKTVQEFLAKIPSILESYKSTQDPNQFTEFFNQYKRLDADTQQKAYLIYSETLKKLCE